MQQIYIAVVIAVLAVIVALRIFVKKIKPETKLTPLAAFSFAFVIAGIVFGENRLVGYSLMGIGVLIAFFDAIKKLKK